MQAGMDWLKWPEGVWLAGLGNPGTWRTGEQDCSLQLI